MSNKKPYSQTVWEDFTQEKPGWLRIWTVRKAGAAVPSSITKPHTCVGTNEQISSARFSIQSQEGAARTGSLWYD